jgi:hypothetical protein
MYPQGNAPEPWPQYDQQPYPQGPYQQGPYQQPPQQMPQYQVAPYQQPGYPGQPFPGPGVYGPPPSRSRAPLIIVGAVLGVLVLVCALAVFVVRLGATADGDDGTERAGPAPTSEAPATTPTAPPTGPSADDSPTEESVEGDLARFKVGDCLTITGAENTVNPAGCTDSGAYKVLLRRDGTTDEKVCDSTDATEILYQDGAGTSRDLVLCVAPAK